MGSEQNRFPQHERRKRWGGCLGAFSCFGSQKGGKRIVPASRIPDNNGSASQPNGPQATGLTNQAPGIAPSLLAPPSSPASFTHSALPSTAQSPSCFLSLSANSPGGPSSTMYATGPYAHETQLVSPPVFSNFTTEPSTAPLTPPPELAHLTTPSSPDVPFAHFLTSSANLKNGGKGNYITANDLQTTYSLYPGSPASSLISPISRNSGDCLSTSFPEREFRPQWDSSMYPENGKYQRTGSGRVSGHDTNDATMASQDTNFFCPATYAQFYLDQNPPFPHNGGRLSVSKDSDAQSTGGNGHQSRPSRSPKQDVEEIEAYRASFGFSADEIITTSQYVEISDVMDDSFTMMPLTAGKSMMEESIEPSLMKGFKAQETQVGLQNLKCLRLDPGPVGKQARNQVPICDGYEDHKSPGHCSNSSGLSTPDNHKSPGHCSNMKVPLYKTVLLKYYNQALRTTNGSHKSQNGRACHRDEFIRCTRCNKERRFRLRTKEGCRIHHDALADPNWNCSNLPYDKITCDNEEERGSRRVYRGCTRSAACKGCTSCVCFGCEICRFSDCTCQTCTDFTRNAIVKT